MNNFWYRNYEEINYLSLADLNGGVGQTPFTAKKEAKGILGFIFEVLGEPAMVHDDEHTNKLFQDYIWPRFYQEAIVRGEGKDDIGRVLGGIYSWVMATKDNYGYLIDTYESKKDLLLGQVKTTQTTDTNNSGTSKTTSNDTMNGEVNGTTSGNGSDKVVASGNNDTTTHTTSTGNTKLNVTPQIANLVDSDDYVNNITKDTGEVNGSEKTTNSSTNTTTSTNSNTAKTTTKDTKQGTVNGETTDTGKSTTSIASDGDTLMARIKEVREGIENVYETWCEEFKQFIIW